MVRGWSGDGAADLGYSNSNLETKKIRDMYITLVCGLPKIGTSK
jgi:hypothetical protein